MLCSVDSDISQFGAENAENASRVSARECTSVDPAVEGTIFIDSDTGKYAPGDLEGGKEGTTAAIRDGVCGDIDSETD